MKVNRIPVHAVHEKIGILCHFGLCIKVNIFLSDVNFIPYIIGELCLNLVKKFIHPINFSNVVYNKRLSYFRNAMYCAE